MFCIFLSQRGRWASRLLNGGVLVPDSWGVGVAMLLHLTAPRSGSPSCSCRHGAPRGPALTPSEPQALRWAPGAGPPAGSQGRRRRLHLIWSYSKTPFQTAVWGVRSKGADLESPDVPQISVFHPLEVGAPASLRVGGTDSELCEPRLRWLQSSGLHVMDNRRTWRADFEGGTVVPPGAVWVGLAGEGRF